VVTPYWETLFIVARKNTTDTIFPSVCLGSLLGYKLTLFLCHDCVILFHDIHNTYIYIYKSTPCMKTGVPYSRRPSVYDTRNRNLPPHLGEEIWNRKFTKTRSPMLSSYNADKTSISLSLSLYQLSINRCWLHLIMVLGEDYFFINIQLSGYLLLAIGIYVNLGIGSGGWLLDTILLGIRWFRSFIIGVEKCFVRFNNVITDNTSAFGLILFRFFLCRM
jgi:hypothetical protein